jgi:hypothetical protein
MEIKLLGENIFCKRCFFAKSREAIHVSFFGVLNVIYKPPQTCFLEMPYMYAPLKWKSWQYEYPRF